MRVLRICIGLLFSLLILGNAAIAAPVVEFNPPKMPGASLCVPWEDFKGIIEKLGQVTPPEEDPPPIAGVVSAANYVADVRAEGVVVTAEIELSVLKKDGWASIPVITTGLPLASASLDGKATVLMIDNGLLHAVVRGFGAHRLKLEMRLPLQNEGGPEKFRLPTAKAQINRLEVRVGQPNLQVSIEPGGALASTTTGGKTVATGSFAPGDAITVRWARRAEKTTKAEARVSAEVRTMLTVGEGLGVYTSIIDFDIQHKPISRFEIDLPADVAVADVSTDGLVDWQLVDQPEGQRLTVAIAYEAVGRHQVALTLEQPLPAKEQTKVAVADIKVRDIVHEVGYLAVAVRTNVQVTADDSTWKNLAPLDVSELPADLRGTTDQQVLLGFKYIKHPYALDLQIVKHKDAAVLTCKVEWAAYRIMLTGDGKQLIEGTFRIANRSLQYLTLTLPPDTDLWGVFRDGVPVKAAESDGKILLPIFRGGLRDTFTMKILAYRKSGGLLPVGRRSLELPRVDVSMGKAQLAVFMPPDRRYFSFGGKLRPSTDPLPTGAVSGEESDVSGSGGQPRNKLTGLLGRNVDYRRTQSQVQWKAEDAPINMSNAGYDNTLSRGALPVVFLVQWQGEVHRFAKNLVDPDEKLDLSFYYTKRSRSAWLGLVLFLLCVAFGYLFAVSFLCG